MSPTPPDLTAKQQHVLALIAYGHSARRAAETAGIHRNTVTNWRRSSPEFRLAWDAAQTEQTLHWRDELQSIAGVAVATLTELMIGHATAASVRYKAAQFVLEKVIAPASQPQRPAPPQPALAEAIPVEQPCVLVEYPAAGLPEPPAALPEIVDAPPCDLLEMPHPPATPAPVQLTPYDEGMLADLIALDAQDAQSGTTRPYRSPPAPGRNDPCPCGSGLKYKRCCLNAGMTAAALKAQAA